MAINRDKQPSGLRAATHRLQIVILQCDCFSLFGFVEFWNKCTCFGGISVVFAACFDGISVFFEVYLNRISVFFLHSS